MTTRLKNQIKLEDLLNMSKEERAKLSAEERVRLAVELEKHRAEVDVLMAPNARLIAEGFASAEDGAKWLRESLSPQVNFDIGPNFLAEFATTLYDIAYKHGQAGHRRHRVQ